MDRTLCYYAATTGINPQTGQQVQAQPCYGITTVGQEMSEIQTSLQESQSIFTDGQNVKYNHDRGFTQFHGFDFTYQSDDCLKYVFDNDWRNTYTMGISDDGRTIETIVVSSKDEHDEYRFDDSGRCTSLLHIDDDGTDKSGWEYDTDGNVIRYYFDEDADGTYESDVYYQYRNGQMVSMEEDGATTYFDTEGRPIKMVEPEDGALGKGKRTTEFEYDKLGQLKNVDVLTKTRDFIFTIRHREQYNFTYDKETGELRGTKYKSNALGNSNWVHYMNDGRISFGER